MSYIWVTNDGTMKKGKKTTLPKEPEPNIMQEPAVFYGTVSKTPSLKDITYNEFKKVAAKAPFSQAEWANILHISERTLQRYAKDNHTFASINGERFVLMAKVLQEAKNTFGNTENFYAWLKRNPHSLEGTLSFESLTSFEGIQNVLIQMGRIQHGLFA